MISKDKFNEEYLGQELLDHFNALMMHFRPHVIQREDDGKYILLLGFRQSLENEEYDFLEPPVEIEVNPRDVEEMEAASKSLVLSFIFALTGFAEATIIGKHKH